MTGGDRFEPATVLDQIVAATKRLLETSAGFSDADVREPSLLPGWSRGHVLTHLARNADGGSRLLIWARTGVETPEYPSMAARAEEIEAGAGRSASELVADVRDSATQFADEYGRLPASAWERMIRWTGGQEHPAARAADARLCEALVHHVDLDADYTPDQWPADFTGDMLSRAVASFTSRADAPAMRLHATDSNTWYDVGTARTAPTDPRPAVRTGGVVDGTVQGNRPDHAGHYSTAHTALSLLTGDHSRYPARARSTTFICTAL